MNPYSAYRPSGIMWIGDVPEHWEIKRLKIVASINDDTLTEREDPLRPIAYIDISSVDAIIGITKMKELVFEDAPSRARRLVCDGDTIVSTVRTYLRAIAPVSSPPKEMVVSTGFAVIRPRSLVPGFASWILREQGLVQEIVARSTGISYPAVNASQIGDLPVLLPPFDEQSAIAEYLDRETERIVTLVVKQQLFIERLKEYRAALITQTVTRGLPPEAAHAAGLDPSPRLKSSGVSWIGDVPEHWEIRRLRHSAVYKPSNVDKKSKDGELPVRLCNYTDVYYGNRIRVSDCIFMEATASSDEVKRFRLRVGDVLITKDSEDWRDIGIPAIVSETAKDFVCGYHLGVIRTGPALDASFLYFTLQAEPVNQQLQVSAQGVTRYGLTVSAIRKLIHALPPLDEQRAIAAYLDRETERIDALLMKQLRLIQRLQEYRKALITAVVTGTVDVREQSMGLARQGG